MTTLRSSLAATAAVVLAALLGPVAPAPAADGRAAPRSPVSVSINDGADGGRVASRSAPCERGRGVTVLAFTSRGVIVLGDDTTDRQGRWSTRADAHKAGAKGLALVPGDARCAPAQSRYVPLPERAGKAKRTISLRGGGTNPNGQVASSSAACERGVDVVLFERDDDPSAPWELGGTTTTDRRGHYDFRGRRAAGHRGGSYQLTTVAVGTGACRLAQSPIMVVRSR